MTERPTTNGAPAPEDAAPESSAPRNGERNAGDFGYAGERAARRSGPLGRLLALRFRLATQLYFGIAAAVSMTLIASCVGVISFNTVAESQRRVLDESVPEMTTAFAVAQTSGEFVATGSQLATAASPSAFARIVRDVNASRTRLQTNIAELEAISTDVELFQRIDRDVNILIDNIAEVEDLTERLFDLSPRASGTRNEIESLTTNINQIIVPAIDDQIFFVITGHRTLGEPALPLEEHLSTDQVDTFQRLSQLHADATLANQILTSAFTLSQVAEVEPLRERFWAVEGRILSNLRGLDAHELYRDLEDLFVRLLNVGSRPGGTFDLAEEDLRLRQQQDELLATNRGITVRLLSNGDVLTLGAQQRADDAAAASTQAISTGRMVLIAISVASALGAVVIAWLFIGRSLLRRLSMLSAWMREMAAGDLTAQAAVGGRDEVADMAAALEVFRQNSLEAQRLNLVEQLANELQGKNDQLEAVLADLEKAQDQIVMQEKLAALGELTAGVAHEIRNPLNFIKNFSEASGDLINELNEIVEDEEKEVTADDKSYIKEVIGDLEGNLERILSHSGRANRIVEDMLRMGRSSTARQMTDINLLLDEYTRLAYHSGRATDPDMIVDLQFDLDESIGEIEVLSQEMGRVFLNMVSNACYATNEKHEMLLANSASTDYMPTLWLSTKLDGDNVIIRVRDNGMGIPDDVKEKIFNPFFTTKPTDKGTGLGLAITSDIVRTHGGFIEVESQEGEYTEMKVTLPRFAPHVGEEEPLALGEDPDDDDDDEPAPAEADADSGDGAAEPDDADSDGGDDAKP